MHLHEGRWRIRVLTHGPKYALWLGISLIIVLLVLRPNTPQTNRLWKPDDAAAFVFAVGHADAETMAAPWSVHPGALAWILGRIAQSVVTNRHASSGASLLLYVCLLFLLRRALRSGSAHFAKADVERSARSAARSGDTFVLALLSVSIVLSPVITSLLPRLNEDLVASAAVAAMLCCVDGVMRGASRLSVFGLILASCVVTFEHVYGIFLTFALLVAFVVTSLTAGPRGQFAASAALAVLIGCGTPVAVVLLRDQSLDWQRWHEVVNHYWVHSVWAGAPGIPLAGLGSDASELALTVPAVGAALEILCSLVLVSGCFSSNPSVRLVCLAALCTLLTFAACETAVGGGIMLQEHKAPLYTLVFVAVARFIYTIPQRLESLRPVCAAIIVLSLAVPSILYRVVDDAGRNRPESFAVVRERIHQTADSTPIVIAGSRLFFLLCEEDPRMLSRTLLVYVPAGSVPDRSPARHLVPRQLRQERCPLASREISDCLYVQMTGSQMTRCSLQAWHVMWFSTLQHPSLAVLEVFVARLQRARRVASAPRGVGDVNVFTDRTAPSPDRRDELHNHARSTRTVECARLTRVEVCVAERNHAR